jgi:hypothetical protein
MLGSPNATKPGMPPVKHRGIDRVIPAQIGDQRSQLFLLQKHDLAIREP